MMMKSGYHTNEKPDLYLALPVLSPSVRSSVYFFTDLNTSQKKSRRNMTKRPRRGNMSTKRMRRMRFIRFLMNTFSYSPGCCLCSPDLFCSLRFLHILGHQAQKEDKRQKGNRGKESQKRRRGEVEMVRSFWGQIVLFLRKLHTKTVS